MTTFQIHTVQDAPESRETLEATQRTFGFVPNLIAVMAESPALAEGYLALTAIFGRTDLNETERQIILMTNSRLNGCDYCMAAHTTISQMKVVPANVIAALRAGTPIADPKLEALRVFAEQVNLTRGRPAESDLDAFLAAGYTQRTVFEVIIGTSLKVLSNYTNHIAETPVDSAFAKNVWKSEEACTSEESCLTSA